MLTTLKQFLDERGAPYKVLTHRPAFTAQEVAAAQHVPGRELAKVVVVRVGAGHVLVVLSALQRLDIRKLARVTSGLVCLASEEEFAQLFPRCEPGAMPPFGNLYGLPVYVDRKLAADEHIVFQAGSHTETIRMRYADFSRLAQPISGDFELTHEEVT